MNSDTYESEMRKLEMRSDQLEASLNDELARAIHAEACGVDVDLDTAYDEFNARLKALYSARLSAERMLEEKYYYDMMGASA